MEPGGKKLNILVVDDTPMNIQIVGELLHTDYNVSVANSGKKALEVVEKRPPDLILLDVMMPEMDGFETASKIYQNPKNRDVPIIFFSADSTIDYKEKGFDSELVDFITKPFEPTSFLLKIGSWAQRIRKTQEEKI